MFVPEFVLSAFQMVVRLNLLPVLKCSADEASRLKAIVPLNLTMLPQIASRMAEAVKLKARVHPKARQLANHTPAAHRSPEVEMKEPTVDGLSNAASATVDSSSKLAQAVDT